MEQNRHTGSVGHVPDSPSAGATDQSSIENLPLAGYPILSTTAFVLSKMLKERLAATRKTVLAFANTNLVLKCQAMLPWMDSDEVVLVNDGIGLDIAALLMHGHRYRANLNGTDFVPYFLKNLSAQRKIFLFGGQPGVAEKAAAVIERDYGQDVVGCLNGYSALSPQTLHRQINESGAEIVLVALGNPIQEEWIRSNMHALDAKLFIGVGALFDFLSGAARRAPLWIQKIRCEWLFRLAQEPKRLMRRYTVEAASFLYLCLSTRRTRLLS